MIIYLITNLITQKVYVGKTSHTLADRWSNHLSNARLGKQEYLYRAIRKYGIENFQVQQITQANSEEQLNGLEILWILVLQASNPVFGYNMTAGGEGVPLVGEAKERHRQSAIKRAQTKEGQAHLAELAVIIGDYHRGKPKPPEQRAKLALHWDTERKARQSSIATAYNLKANKELRDFSCDKCGKVFTQVPKGVFGGHRRACLLYR